MTDRLIGNFIDNYVVKDGEYTHQSMIVPKCKFFLNKKQQDDFWNLYCNNLYKQSVISGISEKPSIHMPIIVDVDINISSKLYTGNEKLYNKTHVLETIRTYQSVLKNIIYKCTDNMLTCILLEKPPYKVKSGDSCECKIKNGFHLHFPNIFIHTDDYKTHLLPKVLASFKESKLFDELGDVSKIIDDACTRVPWLIYGASKHASLHPYTYSACFDHELNGVDVCDALSNYKIYDAHDELISVDKVNVMKYLPRILSITPSNRPIQKLSVNVPNIKAIQTIRTNIENKQTVDVDIDVNFVSALVGILSADRAQSYGDWMDLGWTLYNVTGGSEDGFELWNSFSKLSPTQYNEQCCVDAWNKSDSECSKSDSENMMVYNPSKQTLTSSSNFVYCILNDSTPVGYLPGDIDLKYVYQTMKYYAHRIIGNMTNIDPTTQMYMYMTPTGVRITNVQNFLVQYERLYTTIRYIKIPKIGIKLKK